MTDLDPVEVTEPVDVVAWLRALPHGTVLIDGRTPARAWQKRAWHKYSHCWDVRDPIEFSALLMVGSEEAYDLADDDDAAAVAHEGPWVAWMPPVGGTS